MSTGLQQDTLDQIIHDICSRTLGIANAKPGDRQVRVLRELVSNPVGLTVPELCKVIGTEDKHAPARVIYNLKQAAKDHRRGRGLHLPWCLYFPDEFERTHRYRVILVPNETTPDFEGLWWPHLWRKHAMATEALPTSVVITEPQFFRHASGKFYVRHFDVNSSDSRDLVKTLPALGSDPEEFKLSPHFVSLGEVKAAHRVMEGLRNIRPSIPTTFLSHREVAYKKLCDGHIVLLGTSRANVAISEFQRRDSRLYFIHRHNGVLSKSPKKRFADQPGRHFYGIYSRVSDREALRVKSVIACNHGPATQAITEYLFSTAVEEEVVPKLKALAEWKGFPDRVQLLFRVVLPDDGDEEVTPTPLLQEAVLI